MRYIYKVRVRGTMPVGGDVLEVIADMLRYDAGDVAGEVEVEGDNPMRTIDRFTVVVHLAQFTPERWASFMLRAVLIEKVKGTPPPARFDTEAEAGQYMAGKHEAPAEAPDPERSRFDKLPPNLRAGFRAYIDDHHEPGDFIMAVLENNLRDAFGRADLVSRAALFDIVVFMWNDAPSVCWGSPEKVAKWLKDGAASSSS